jgi:putative transcriptional regulator
MDTGEGTHGGRLVVAAQGLVDPNFAHTVVLLIEHDEDGAFGVVLNRPGDVPISEALAPWAALTAEPPVIFTGGPVQPEGVIALGRTHAPTGAPEVLGGVEVVDLDGDPALAAAELRSVRLFSGYAGWAPGQLEAELADGGWFVVDADPADVVSSDPANLWRAVLARQGGLFVTVSEDPSLN